MRSRSISLYKVRGEENPADLFTKHLVGRDRIHGLLRLFGCEYRGGRAGAAPQVRAGATTSKGELLHLKSLVQNPVEWGDRVFERAADCTEQIPEAFSSQDGILPHMHDDMADRYPQAVACAESLDLDPPTHDGLETRGRREGSSTERYKK